MRALPHLRSPGDLKDVEVDEVVDFLNERVQTQEKTELFQLQNLFEIGPFGFLSG